MPCPSGSPAVPDGLVRGDRRLEASRRRRRSCTGVMTPSSSPATASTTLKVEPTAFASWIGAVEQRVVGVRVGELLVVLGADARRPRRRVVGRVAGHGRGPRRCLTSSTTAAPPLAAVAAVAVRQVDAVAQRLLGRAPAPWRRWSCTRVSPGCGKRPPGTASRLGPARRRRPRPWRRRRGRAASGRRSTRGRLGRSTSPAAYPLKRCSLSCSAEISPRLPSTCAASSPCG